MLCKGRIETGYPSRLKRATDGVFFVVRARNKKGMPYERLALMAKKKITEEDVKRFLYDVDLSHLYVASEQ